MERKHRPTTMEKVVVTGGAGFIGSALVRALLASGTPRVTVIDNLSSGSRANLEEVRAGVDIVVCDIRDYTRVAPLVQAPRASSTWPRFPPCRSQSTSRCRRMRPTS